MRLNKSHVFQGPLRNALSNLDLVFLRGAQKQFAFLSAKHFLKYFSRIFFSENILSCIIYLTSDFYRIFAKYNPWNLNYQPTNSKAIMIHRIFLSNETTNQNLKNVVLSLRLNLMNENAIIYHN